MKTGIGAKLALLLAVFAVFAAGFTGYYSHAESRRLLLTSAEGKLLGTAQSVAREMQGELSAIERDARLLASLPVVAVLHDSSHPNFDWSREGANRVFAALMSLNPDYFQVRYIARTRHGREVVRVDRENGQPLVVEGRNLQEKGHYPYVFRTLRLRRGETYLSDIKINRNPGAHEAYGQPTVLVATPVVDAAGVTQGLIIISVDLKGVFTHLQQGFAGESDIYLATHRGDFLMHPDPSLAFSFERGRRVLMQATLPGTEDLFASRLDHLILKDAHTPNNSPAITALTRVDFGESDARFVVLGLSRPVSAILADSERLAKNIVKLVLGFSLLALVVALVTARLATRPLEIMVKALRRFSESREIVPLPVRRRDEIGVLARSMDQMRNEVLRQLDTLYQNRTDLDHMARHDSLTGLPNRLMFNDTLAAAIDSARLQGKKLAVLFVDLDRFKQINDSLGHEVGDEVLKRSADNFRTLLRKSDTIARLGGDEFVVLLPEIDDGVKVSAIARKIVQKFQQPLLIGEHDLHLSVSIGITLYPQDGSSAAELVRHADMAMYKAKHDGRNNYQFYTPDMSARAVERMKLENELRLAVERGELILHYQPQVDLASGRLTGAEALVRWHHPQLGLLGPDRFIPLAEESDLILLVGEYVLQTACHQVADWQQRLAKRLPSRFRVAVNMADRQLRSKNLLHNVQYALKITDCSPDWLELEVTEGFFMAQPEEAVAQLESLRNSGVELSIDDFGTGYSSLAHLKALPVNKLKIDRSFVRDIPADTNDMAIASTIIAMARSLEMDVIAEGVETVEQRDFLLRQGCHQAQGYLYGKPMPVEGFERWLEERHAITG